MRRFGSYLDRVYGVDIQELCKKLNVSRWKIYHLHKNGSLKHLEVDSEAKNNYELSKKDFKRVLQCRRNVYQRCNSPRDKKYKNYGGRGIKAVLSLKELCDLWKRDGAGLMKKPSIDRIDGNGHYVFSNCRFMEFEQNIKMRASKKCLVCGYVGRDVHGWKPICSDCKIIRKCPICQLLFKRKKTKFCDNCIIVKKPCANCGSDVLRDRRTQAGFIRNKNWFCNRSCFGKYIGNKHGFGAITKQRIINH